MVFSFSFLFFLFDLSLTHTHSLISPFFSTKTNVSTSRFLINERVNSEVINEMGFQPNGKERETRTNGVKQLKLERNQTQ